jgi:hypothetical protein
MIVLRLTLIIFLILFMGIMAARQDARLTRSVSAAKHEVNGMKMPVLDQQLSRLHPHRPRLPIRRPAGMRLIVMK